MGCEEKFMKPRTGLIVRGPDYVLLPESGAYRECSSYWLRRLRDGDVVIATKAQPKPAPPKEEAKKMGGKV